MIEQNQLRKSGDQVTLNTLAGGCSDVVVPMWNLSPAFIYISRLEITRVSRALSEAKNS
jgi:hypothetical protein